MTEDDDFFKAGQMWEVRTQHQCSSWDSIDVVSPIPSPIHSSGRTARWTVYRSCTVFLVRSLPCECAQAFIVLCRTLFFVSFGRFCRPFQEIVHLLSLRLSSRGYQIFRESMILIFLVNKAIPHLLHWTSFFFVLLDSPLNHVHII